MYLKYPGLRRGLKYTYANNYIQITQVSDYDLEKMTAQLHTWYVVEKV